MKGHNSTTRFVSLNKCLLIKYENLLQIFKTSRQELGVPI